MEARKSFFSDRQIRAIAQCKIDYYKLECTVDQWLAMTPEQRKQKFPGLK